MVDDIPSGLTDVSGEAEHLARRIMDLTEAEASSRAVINVALLTCLASYWAKRTHDLGDPPEAAEAAVRHYLDGCARQAAALLRRRYRQDGEAAGHA